jgi:long-chain acyl-CoA synthetase
VACPGQDVLIVDEDGNELPAGESGEIVVRGDVVMMGYHNKPSETGEALAGGVLHTGDVGYKDEDGYIFIVDRLKDMVIRGGENIYPKEIDNLLVEHPKIRDAACVGVPDEVLGEEICAYVIVREGETLEPAEIRDYCAQHLARYKVPRYVKVLQTDFPRNAVGKILKKEMKRWKVDEGGGG